MSFSLATLLLVGGRLCSTGKISEAGEYFAERKSPGDRRHATSRTLDFRALPERSPEAGLY
jgi:hypothetical protein